MESLLPRGDHYSFFDFLNDQSFLIMAIDSSKLTNVEQVERVGDGQFSDEKQPDTINAVSDVQPEDEKISWRLGLAFVVPPCDIHVSTMY